MASSKVRLMRIFLNNEQNWCVHENYLRCVLIVPCLHYKDANIFLNMQIFGKNFLVNLHIFQHNRIFFT